MAEIHMDPNVLSGLQEVMEGEYPKLLATFLDDSQKRIEALRQARDDAKRWGGLRIVSRAAAATLGQCVWRSCASGWRRSRLRRRQTWARWSI